MNTLISLTEGKLFKQGHLRFQDQKAYHLVITSEEGFVGLGPEGQR